MVIDSTFVFVKSPFPITFSVLGKSIGFMIVLPPSSVYPTITSVFEFFGNTICSAVGSIKFFIFGGSTNFFSMLEPTIKDKIFKSSIYIAFE